MDRLVHGKVCVAIKFSKKASEQAVSWFTERVSADKLDYGCQLTVKQIKTEDDEVILLVSASKVRMFVGAEILGIRKKYKDGTMREFNISDEHNFSSYGDDDFITDAECLYIIKSELNTLRALDEMHVPGHEQIHLYPGKSILRKLESSKLVTDVLSLHDQVKLKKLCVNWYRNHKVTLDQPVGEIRNYFGETISMYFSFLGFYTKGLLPLIILSLPLYFLTNNWSKIHSCTSFAILNTVWASFFLKSWKRKSVGIAYKYGNFQKREWEEPRGSFRGVLGINPITGLREPCYPGWKRNLRICLVSGPIVSACIMSAVFIMFYYFSWDFYFATKYDGIGTFSSKIQRNIPSIIYSILVLVANLFYRQLAEHLTDQENHRLESSYQNHLITKIVLFDFVNNFLCLFYIAFIYNNMTMLRMTLRNLFIVQIIVSQTFESAVPYWRYKHRSRSKRTSRNEMETSDEYGDLVTQVGLEMERDTYDGTFDDYLELWLQFGYVVMFSCVFPFAAILAFINNVVEIRSDAFKMCSVFRRPDSIPARGIGAWQVAFEIISYLGVVSNCALIFQSPSFQDWFYKLNPTAGPITLLLWFVAIEHLLLLMRYLLSAMIPSAPGYVIVAVAKMQYKSMQALKRQRAASLHPSEILKRSLRLLRSKDKNGSEEITSRSS